MTPKLKTSDFTEKRPSRAYSGDMCTTQALPFHGPLAIWIEFLYKNTEVTIGARKFVVTGFGPVGCIPAISKSTPHEGECAESIN
uniref:Uncharacterized protein n=1 Tax=Salix viminalis TaxID=40686 RepID=A0A6N2M3G2_SALVM